MGGPLGAGDGVGLGLEGVVLVYFYGLEGLGVSFWGLGEGVLLGLEKILWGLGEGGVLLRLGLYFGGWGEGPIGAGWPFWGLGVFLVRLGGHFGVSPPRMTSYGSILMSPIPPGAVLGCSPHPLSYCGAVLKPPTPQLSLFSPPSLNRGGATRLTAPMAAPAPAPPPATAPLSPPRGAMAPSPPQGPPTAPVGPPTPRTPLTLAGRARGGGAVVGGGATQWWGCG